MKIVDYKYFILKLNNNLYSEEEILYMLIDYEEWECFIHPEYLISLLKNCYPKFCDKYKALL